MRVLIACEFSGIVREAFKKRGHTALSVDFEPTEIPGWHHVGDVRRVLAQNWDLMVAFPPCTYICRSGQSHHSETDRMYDALSFVSHLMCAPIPRIAIENPVGRISTYIRRPDQIVQPWQFGHPVTKATCLWLKGLPPLTPTDLVDGPYTSDVMATPKGPSRGKERSRTYPGLAAAMADQWGSIE